MDGASLNPAADDPRWDDWENPLRVPGVALPQGKCYRATFVASPKMLPKNAHAA